MEKRTESKSCKVKGLVRNLTSNKNKSLGVYFCFQISFENNYTTAQKRLQFLLMPANSNEILIYVNS